MTTSRNNKKLSYAQKNNKEFLESCVEEEVKNTLEIIGLQGGYFSESKIMTKPFSSGSTYGQKNIAVLCYNKNYFDPCINQEASTCSFDHSGFMLYFKEFQNLFLLL